MTCSNAAGNGDLPMTELAARPASGEQGLSPQPWLGHRDLCSLQWSPICDCDPNQPIDFTASPEDTETQ